LEDTEVSIIESLEDMSLIEFLDVESDEIVEGYVDNDNLLYLSETDDLNESSSESEESNIEDSNDNSDSGESDSEKSDEGTVDDEADIEESEDSSKNGDTESEESGEDSNDDEAEAEDPEEDSTEEDVDSEESNEESNNKDSDEVKSNEEDSHNSKQILKQTVKKQESLSVVGLRNPTNVREIDSTKSKVITSFPAGTIIELQTFSENWYEVSVDVNGEKTLGYIHHKHVDEIKKEQSTFQGIALKNPTNIRKLASTKSN